jgi:hypothetical protein
VGNVAGSTDLLNVTSYNNGTHKIPAVSMIVAPQNRSYDATTYCFGFGYSEASDDGSFAEDNRLPYTTAILHGNYDYASDSTKWDPSISDHVLPASYYLPGKPAWWGTMPWPAIGPDLNPMVNKIPAQVRFETGSNVINVAAQKMSGLSLRLMSINSTKIKFQIPTACHVTLEVFNASGKRVATLVNGKCAAGSQTVFWNEAKCPAGVYLYKLTAGELKVTGKGIIVE